MPWSAVCEGGSVDQFESTPALVGYQGTASESERLPTLTPIANGTPT